MQDGVAEEANQAISDQEPSRFPPGSGAYGLVPPHDAEYHNILTLSSLDSESLLSFNMHIAFRSTVSASFRCIREHLLVVRSSPVPSTFCRQLFGAAPGTAGLGPFTHMQEDLLCTSARSNSSLSSCSIDVVIIDIQRVPSASRSRPPRAESCFEEGVSIFQDSHAHQCVHPALHYPCPQCHSDRFGVGGCPEHLMGSGYLVSLWRIAASFDFSEIVAAHSSLPPSSLPLPPVPPLTHEPHMERSSSSDDEVRQFDKRLAAGDLLRAFAAKLGGNVLDQYSAA